MTTSQIILGTTVQLSTDFENAIERTTTALKTEGFGVLTEIDVKETLKKKIGVDFRPYRILGACNPLLAHKALTAAPEVGLMLPCNVTVSEIKPGQIEVSLIDPLAMLSILDHPELADIAQEARARLDRVAALLED